MTSNKPYPVYLQIRTSDIDALFEGLKIVQRPKFIGLCKYRGGTYDGVPASYFILKLTEEEAVVLSLKVNMRVVWLPRKADMKYDRNLETHYFE